MRGKHIYRFPLFFLASLYFLQGLSFAQTLFGPNQYTLTTTAPQTFSAVVSATAGPAHLYAVNGNADGSSRLTHASITLNGVEMVSAQDLGDGVALRDSKHHGRLCHRHLPSEDPLDNFCSSLFLHRQGYGCFHTLTESHGS